MEKNGNDDGQQMSSLPNSFNRREIERYKSMYEREREQFEEFQRYSKELEAEMELELKQRDQRISELESVKHRLSAALEQLKTKSDKDRQEHRTGEEQLRTRLLNSDEQCRELRHKLRAVEQQNDDLERRERIHAQQLVDLSERYDQCLERCAMLEAGIAVPCHIINNSNQQQQQSPPVVAHGINGAAAVDNTSALVSSGQHHDQQQPMEFATSSVHNASSTTDTSPEGTALREQLRLTLDGTPSQRLIEQMLRKVEAVEAHLNNSSFSTGSSFYDSPPATKTTAMNGFQRNFNGTNNF